MLDRLLRIEEQFARAEALLLVVFVLLMLSLATYNVFYGNVLVPIQVSLLTHDEAPTTEPAVTPPADTTPEPTPEEPAGDDADGFGGGFGGGFGEPGTTGGDEAGFGGDFGEPKPEPKAKPAADDEAGFGGDFGDPKPEATPEPAAPPASDDSGFGGDFDSPEPTADTPKEDGADGFGGGFGGDFDGSKPSEPAEAAVDTAPEPDTTPTEPKDVPFLARAIDAVKLEWIDVVLRQLVLIVGFLGAMLATRRRKHITIDALSKLLPAGALHWVEVITNSISIVVCILLAKAGSDLVAISKEFPKELTAWADEWQFQLAFPIGFGLLAFHFTIRLIESFMWATGKAEPPEESAHGGIV